MFYVGLAPTMGFVGYSWVVASDKYVYLPAVGLVLVLGWLLKRIWSGGAETGRVVHQVGTVAVVVVAAGLLVAGTRRYLSHWQTTEALCDYMLELAPNAYPVYNSRGNAYKDKGDYDPAIRAYTKAIELKPDYAFAYNNRGNAYNDIRDFGRAIRDHTKAVELKPDYADAYNNRAITHFYLKEYEKAWADVRMYRRLGGKPNAGFISALTNATSRSE
jgi:tetratricopeptide (TPR) repeat protein